MTHHLTPTRTRTRTYTPAPVPAHCPNRYPDASDDKPPLGNYDRLLLGIAALIPAMLAVGFVRWVVHALG